MKIVRICFAILATLTVASAVAAQCGPARPPKAAGTGSLEEMIIAQEKMIIDAIKKGDAATFKSLVDLEGTVIDSSGIQKLSVVIPMLFGSGLKISEYTLEEPQVRSIDKNTAIIHYRSSSTATLPDGKTMSGKSNDTTLFVRRMSKWVAVFHQSSEAAQPAATPTAAN
jgi:hypothetical protein